MERFPELRLLAEGSMPEGDRSRNPVNYWQFEQPAAEGPGQAPR